MEIIGCLYSCQWMSQQDDKTSRTLLKLWLPQCAHETGSEVTLMTAVHRLYADADQLLKVLLKCPSAGFHRSR